jgi:hypothetical protein
MSAQVETPAPAAKKTERKPKVEPLTPEEFEVVLEALVREWQNIYTHYTGQHKKNITFPEGAPGKNEFVGLEKRIYGLASLYKKLNRKVKKKKVTAPATGAPGSEFKGFKQPRYVSKTAVDFINTHGSLPPELRLTPLKEVNGDAVFNIAQATQLFISYVETHRLKGTVKKSEITLDRPLADLFRPHFKEIDRKLIREEGDQSVIDHKTLQSLIPKLFDREIPVLPEVYSMDDRAKTLQREIFLKEKTATNKAAREAVTRATKLENQQKAAQKKAVAMAEKQKAVAAAATAAAQQAVQAAQAAAAAAAATK